MLHELSKPFHSYVHVDEGTVDRLIFSDQAIYDLEMERIFARAWNFMCHESQIPNKGDFFLTYIGEESVIATRDRADTLRVFLNSCRHRGNAVCRAESGNARSFLCTYHGWTYGLDGKLTGVPGYKDFYHGELKREEWGLIPAAKVASYKGFVFATMDPEAPDLEEYLGPVGCMSLDLVAEKGDVVVIDGIQKNQIGCNWKLAVDNLFDWYHGGVTHASAGMSGYSPTGGMTQDAAELALQQQLLNPLDHRVVLGEYGHAISGPRLTPSFHEEMASGTANHLVANERWRERPEAKAALGEVGRDTRGHPNIFPNLWVASGGTQLSLRLPKGPMKTEIWWFTVLPASLSAEERTQRMVRANHTFGPAGIFEQDDGENWDQSTRQTRGPIARRYPLNFSMGLGYGAPKTPGDDGPNYIDTSVNEHAQLWTYRAWADWMDADGWDSLKRNRTPAPIDSV